MIKIGSIVKKRSMARAEYVKNQLEENGIESCIIEVKVEVKDEVKVEVKDEDEVQQAEHESTEDMEFYPQQMQQALLNKEIDIAVYPLNKIDTTTVDGLQIAGVSERTDPCDCIISADSSIVEKGPITLAKGTVIGTNSTRSAALVKHYFPTTEVKQARKNTHVLLQELTGGKYHAIIVPLSAVETFNTEDDKLFVRELSPREFIPAPAKGVLAYECRKDDKEIKKILSRIHNPDVSTLTNVERKVLKEIDENNRSVLGVYCEKVGNNFRAHAAYQPLNPISRKNGTNHSHDGLKIVRVSQTITSGLAVNILNQLNIPYGEQE